MSTDIVGLAQNLARNCGYAVFPVNENKQPAVKDWPHRASRDPDAVMRLWRQHPAPLVGIATGTDSGISVLDIDAKHSAAQLWWSTRHARLLPTRVYATRSGGLHLYFRHRDGIRNSQGRICPGVDTRGDGGYVVSWWCAGLECRDHSLPAPFPEWLHGGLTREPRRPAHANAKVGHSSDRNAIIGIVERVARASEGERNGVLYWAACRCLEKGALDTATRTSLMVAARAAGLPDVEARNTIASAMGRQA